MCRLGEIYGIRENYEAAIKWFSKAAREGNPDAQYNLGLIYYDGKGVEQNYEEAFKWFGRASEQGHSLAKKALNMPRFSY